MNIQGKSVLITGANRGIGRALLEEALARGATTVYAAARQPFLHPDARVRSVELDVTDTDHIARLKTQIRSLDVLVNNAGMFEPDDLADEAVLRRHLAVNADGPLRVAQAMRPLLARSSGAIVNVISIAAVAPMPAAPAYSMSKAALWSQTVTLRRMWAGAGIRVHAVFPGPVDTDMVRELEIPKAPAEQVAREVFDRLAAGEDDIFPDPMTAGLRDGWSQSPAKALEQQFARTA